MAEIKYSLYNHIILFLIYIGNMIKYFVTPKKNKIAKIHPILETQCIYDEETNYSNDNYATNCIIQFNSLTNEPLSCYHVKSKVQRQKTYYPYTKNKID